MAVALKIQNIYGDFLRSFKVFLDRVTGNTLNKIEWNYGAKPLEYYYMMNGHESFEYPVALIDIQDLQPVDGVGPIARNAGMQIHFSAHQQLLSENKTRLEKITLDKRWINMIFTVTINTEDVTALLNYHDLFITTMPLNFMFYDYKYYTYIEVTPFVVDWDFTNDDIENVFIRMDPTFRYTADRHYNESIHPNFETQERDRIAGRDMDPIREGERYFSQVKFEPILKIQSVTKQTDKENQQHSLTISFEAQLEIPNLLILEKEFLIEAIEVVIDTDKEMGIAHDYPILIDIEENFLINKNIRRGIIVLSEDFKLSEPLDTDPSYLEIKTDIDLDVFTPSLWAVEDVTDVSSKRFFIPLEHATVERIEENGEFVELRFYFVELEWFRNFDFENQYNFMEMILFAEEP